MNALSSDLRHALRSLARRPAFSIVAILTLALGIGATTGIYSVVSGVLLHPLPYATADRIVVIAEHDVTEPSEVGLGMISAPNFRDVGAVSTSFDALAQFRRANVTVTRDDFSELEPGGQVSADFFRVFGAEPVLGRAFTEDEARHGGPAVAIVAHGFWRERMGADPAAVGRTLQLQGRTYQVVGVAPAGFDYPGGARIWLPMQLDESGCGRGCVQYSGIGLLKAGVPPEVARVEVGAIGERLSAEYPEPNVNTRIDVQTLHEVTTGDVATALYVVFAAVVMLLMIACANVANLMLVRGAGRREEMAVRAVLGAGRARIVAQLLAESAVLALMAAVIGVVIAAWGVDVLREHAPETLPRIAGVGLDGGAVLFAVLVACVTVAIFGLLPALHLSAPFADGLRERGRGGTGSQRGRSAVLAVEVALSVCLLLGAGLLLRSLSRMQAVDPGFDATGVMQFRIGLPGARYPEPAQGLAFVEQVGDRLGAVPGVESVGFVVGLPMSSINIFGGFTRLDRPAPAPDDEPSATYRAIDPGYLATLRVPLLAGRNFDERDRDGTLPVALVNRALARRYFPGEDPIGKQIDVQVSVGYPDTLPRTIVGVIGDVRSESLTLQAEPSLYVPAAQAGADFGHFVVRSALPPAEVVRASRGVVADIDPLVPLIRPGPMADFLEADTSRHAFYLVLIGVFAVAALVLAAVGTYGVVAFAVAQRTREIGLRVALGAHAREVVSLVLWQGLRPALIGAAVGVGAALAAGRVLAGLLFEVRPQDPLTLIGVAAILLVVVVAACAVPTLRATRVAPATALRTD